MQKKSTYILRCAIVVAVLLLTLNTGYAQQSEEKKSKPLEGWAIGAAFHTGRLFSHHGYMSILTEKNSWIAEVYLAKQTDGSKGWHSFFGYPDYGVKLAIVNIGSPTYLGKAYTLHPFVKFYLCKRNHRFTPSIMASAGPAYVEKIFDRHTNYKNTAIGSHINAFLQLQFDLNIRITNNVQTFVGLSLSHFSNGSFKKPNAGANIFTAKIGAAYSIGGLPKQPLVKDYEETPSLALRNWRYQAVVSGGVKRIDIGDDAYGVLSASFEASRKHLAFTRFSGSLDVFYDGSDYHANHNQLYYSGNTNRLQTIKLGVAAGYELLFGKLSINFQLGAYLYAKHKENGTVYQRFTVRYMPIDRVGVQFGLKSHMGMADYIELGCIYRIR